MSVCLADLENGVSKMSPNQITLMVMMEKHLDLSILKIGVQWNKVIIILNVCFRFLMVLRILRYHGNPKIEADMYVLVNNQEKLICHRRK